MPRKPAPRPAPIPLRTASFLGAITGGPTSRKYTHNQRIFAQGDAADSVFYLVKGGVKLSVVSARGKEAIIGILGRGAFFGESCLALRPLRQSTAHSVQSSTIARVDKKIMRGLLHREPEFAQTFLAHLLSRNLRIEEDLIDQLFNSSEKRLARVLLLLAHFGRKAKPEAVAPNMTQEALAAMVGTTRARVSYFMNRFRARGFIDYDGDGVRVHNGLLNVLLYD
jgi:CRP/FNR family transcriptional regulator, cyclic AMP receptor protein